MMLAKMVGMNWRKAVTVASAWRQLFSGKEVSKGSKGKIVGLDYRAHSGGCSHRTDEAQDDVGVVQQEGHGDYWRN